MWSLWDLKSDFTGPSLSSESSIKESLRLSSDSMNLRVAQEDFSLRLDAERSVAIRKGDIITLYPHSLHLDPEIYEDPQVPQRFSLEPIGSRWFHQAFRC